MDLNGKKLVVTAVESGIGRAIARQCVRLGAKACVAGNDAAGLKETVNSANLTTGGQAVDFQPDIRGGAAVKEMYDFAYAEFDGITSAVANSGVVVLSPIEQMEFSECERIISVNLSGTFKTVWPAVKSLIRQGRGGSAIATGSSSAVRVIPKAVAYAASKGGVHAMMQALALELAPHKRRPHQCRRSPDIWRRRRKRRRLAR